MLTAAKHTGRRGYDPGSRPAPVDWFIGSSVPGYQIIESLGLVTGVATGSGRSVLSFPDPESIQDIAVKALELLEKCPSGIPKRNTACFRRREMAVGHRTIPS